MGKTTILDAICLALYGRTPRLLAVNAAGNEIMSRNTGECFAEVVFKTRSGTYLAHWGQHRARKQPNGKLAQVRHELSDEPTGRILASKIKDVSRLVEEKTGMTFERFTRSMMLAQGRFAAFLQASPSERAPILEQITGTEIYSDISKLVHTRMHDEQVKLYELQAESRGIVLLSSDEKDQLQHDLSGARSDKAQKSARSQSVAVSLHWLSDIAQVETEIVDITKKRQLAAKEADEFAAERTQLQRAQNALTYEGDYVKLLAFRDDHTKTKTDWEYAVLQKAEAERLLEKERLSLEKAKTSLADQQKEQEEQLKIIKDVRSLDTRINEQQKVVTKAEESLKSLEDDRKRNQEILEEVEEEQKNLQSDRDMIADYRADHPHEQDLVTESSGIIQSITQLKSCRSMLAADELSLKTQQITVTACSQKAVRCEEEDTAYQKQLSSAADTLHKIREQLTKQLDGRELREYRSDYDHLLKERELRMKIVDLEDERTKLIKGTPCPLCGSLEHPYADDFAPELEEVQTAVDQLHQFIEQIEQRKEEVAVGQNTYHDLQLSAERSVSEVQRVKHEMKNAQKELERIEEICDTEKNRVEKLLEEIRKELTKYALHADITKDPDSVVTELHERIDAWKDLLKNEVLLADKGSEIQHKHSEQNGIRQALDKQIASSRGAFEKDSAVLHDLRQSRRDLFDDKDADEYERKLADDLQQSVHNRDAVKEQYDYLGHKVSQLHDRITQLKKEAEDKQQIVDDQEGIFLGKIQTAGFVDEHDFSSSSIPHNELKILQDRAKRIDEHVQQLEVQLTDRKQHITSLKSQERTVDSYKDLQREQESLSSEIDGLMQSIGAMEERQKTYESDRKQKDLLFSRIERQQGETLRWSRLHDLIGSADGKKFRNFAQGITFEVMVSHANKQLERLTDRYLLIRDGQKPLELNVVDNYQAGQIRSTKNLSGGESFLVSLSLALGLSQMASKRVRVDSLFLDEGFGTLDDEALESALEALASLQQHGKMIGLISHVGALKDRIATQISVIRTAQGKSRISGPGCSSS